MDEKDKITCTRTYVQNETYDSKNKTESHIILVAEIESIYWIFERHTRPGIVYLSLLRMLVVLFEMTTPLVFQSPTVNGLHACTQ